MLQVQLIVVAIVLSFLRGSKELTKYRTSVGRLYLFAMTLHQKGLIIHHRDQLLGEAAQERYGFVPSEAKIKTAKNLVQIDEAFAWYVILTFFRNF